MTDAKTEGEQMSLDVGEPAKKWWAVVPGASCKGTPARRAHTQCNTSYCIMPSKERAVELCSSYPYGYIVVPVTMPAETGCHEHVLNMREKAGVEL